MTHRQRTWTGDWSLPPCPLQSHNPRKEGSLPKTRLKAGGPEPPPTLSQPPLGPQSLGHSLLPSPGQCLSTAPRLQAEGSGWRGLGHSHVGTCDMSVARPASGCLCSAPDQHVAHTGTQGTGRRRTPSGRGSRQPKASRLHAARSSCQGGPAGCSAPHPRMPWSRGHWGLAAGRTAPPSVQGLCCQAGLDRV